MKTIKLIPDRFRIYDMWADGSDSYVTVNVGPNMYIDIWFPDTPYNELLSLYALGDVPYSTPLYCNGGYVYSMDSDGDAVAEIDEADIWKVVQFVDDELTEMGSNG